MYSPPVRRAPVPAPPKADNKDARPAMLFLGVLWFVALWLIFRTASAGQARAQSWAISGALAMMLDAARRLKDLAAVVEDGTKLLQRWEAAPELASTHEGQRCIAHLRDLLARCAGVRQAIVVQQALLAIRTVAPGDEAERTAAFSTEPLEGLRSSLEGDGSLPHALASFEAEHERLRADHESAQDVDRFLRELER